MLLGFLAILFTIKGLGGSFNLPLKTMGLARYHGPIVGGAASLLLAAFYLWFAWTRGTEPAELPSPRPGRQKIVAFTAIYLILISVGLYQRARFIHQHPPDIKAADMIPMVLAGLKAVKEGKSPYFPRVL